jgi:uncharacterized protein (TIGR03067 family)
MYLGNDDATEKEHGRFEGVWSIALIEVDGVKRPAPSFATHKVIISKDGGFAVVQGTQVTRGVFKLDVTKTPKHWDQTITQGPGKGRTFSCIYELEGDTYKLCSSYRGGDRPGEFGSAPGSGLIFQVMKRERLSVRDALTEAGRKELAGTWQAVAYALDGNKASADDMKKVQLVIDADGNASARRDGEVFIAGTTDIDPTKSPMTLDISYTEGDIKGKTVLGIYKIDDDILTMCRAGPGHPRPSEFVSSPGSGLTLMTYKRGR